MPVKATVRNNNIESQRSAISSQLEIETRDQHRTSCVLLFLEHTPYGAKLHETIAGLATGLGIQLVTEQLAKKTSMVTSLAPLDYLLRMSSDLVTYPHDIRT